MPGLLGLTFPRSPAETPREYATALAGLFGDDRIRWVGEALDVRETTLQRRVARDELREVVARLLASVRSGLCRERAQHVDRIELVLAHREAAQARDRDDHDDDHDGEDREVVGEREPARGRSFALDAAF